MAKITTNLTFEIKKQIEYLKHRNKKEAQNVIFDLKKNMWQKKKKKKNSPMDFEQCLRKSGVWEDGKAYWNERYCYASKSIEMYNILRNLLATSYSWRCEDGTGWSKFFLEPVLQFPYVCYAPALLRGWEGRGGRQASPPCHKFWLFCFFSLFNM